MTPWWLPRSDRSSSFLRGTLSTGTSKRLALRRMSSMSGSRLTLSAMQDALHRHVRAERLDDGSLALDDSLPWVCFRCVFRRTKSVPRPVPRHGNSPTRRGAATRNPRGRTLRRPVGRHARTPWASWPARASPRSPSCRVTIRSTPWAMGGMGYQRVLIVLHAAFVGKATVAGNVVHQLEQAEYRIQRAQDVFPGKRAPAVKNVRDIRSGEQKQPAGRLRPATDCGQTGRLRPASRLRPMPERRLSPPADGRPHGRRAGALRDGGTFRKARHPRQGMLA